MKQEFSWVTILNCWWKLLYICVNYYHSCVPKKNTLGNDHISGCLTPWDGGTKRNGHFEIFFELLPLFYFEWKYFKVCFSRFDLRTRNVPSFQILRSLESEITAIKSFGDNTKHCKSKIGWQWCQGYIDVGDGCWRRMLETKCVGNNFEMLVTVLAVYVISILYLLSQALGTNI